MIQSVQGHLRESIADMIRPRERMNVWEWARRNVDYGRVPNYDTPFHGPYDPEYMPFWKEIVEGLTDLNVREIAVVKATRMGASENAMINPIAYFVSERPQPVLYLTGDQLTAERFLEKRLRRRLRASKRTAAALADAQATQHDVAFRTMDFRVSWPRSRHAFKQDGWAMVLCDETSVWPEYATDMARRRCDSYPFPHILFVSSPDPMQKRSSDEDPIFLEWERGDKREWNCPDPAGGEFVFRMGAKDADGLRWDEAAKREDGTWDLKKVRETAHYLTPGGATIRNEDRLKVVRAGRWVPTASETAVPGCRSYRMPVFLSPFKAGDFGEIAVSFLKAQQSPVGLRHFVYESLAEKFYEEATAVNEDELKAREAEYELGELSALGVMGKDRRGWVFITVDVQKGHLWYLVREWWAGGDSALLDFGYAVEWQQIDEVARKYGAYKVYPDCGYEERNFEVWEYAMQSQAIPLRGSPSMKYLPVQENTVNPFEGKKNSGELRLLTYTFNSNLFATILDAMMAGRVRQRWAIPKNAPLTYRKQALSEEFVDGERKKKRGHPDNHLADCEKMQIVAAWLHGLYRALVPTEDDGSSGPA